MASGENLGEALDALSFVDIDLGMTNLVVSPTPHKGSYVNFLKSESSLDTVKVTSSGDELHLDLDRSMSEQLRTSDDAASDFNKNSDYVVVSQSNQFCMQDGEHSNGMNFSSVDSPNIIKLFSGGETLCFIETDKICEVSCKPSRRCLDGEKIEHKNKCIKPSKNRRRSRKKLGFDLTSLNIVRKSRTSSAKPARTSIWGSQVQILPDFGRHMKVELSLAREGKCDFPSIRLGKNATGKKALKYQTGHSSSGNNKLPMRPISLKIKIGNSCIIGNQGRNDGASAKEISELFDNGCRIGENVSRDDPSMFEKDKETVMLSDNSAQSEHVDVKSEGVFHQSTCLKALHRLGASTENQFSDVGTSPDSEVINSVPDASQCEKWLPRIQESADHADAIGSAALQVHDMTSINGKMSSEITGAMGSIEARGENEKPSKRGKNKKPSKKKGGHNNIVADQHQVSKMIIDSGIHGRIDSHPKAGKQTPSDLLECRPATDGFIEPLIDSRHPSGAVKDQYSISRNAWVLCDDCQKWRRIPAALADQLEEKDCGWTCKDNTDKDFADCSIPQEKSNSEINEELELSDGSCEEDSRSIFLNCHNELKADQPSWLPIKSNLFLHRKRKTQTIDEVMVCHCKPPSDGKMGCGSKCLNRMLNIECIRGTCPCGNLCSNQQFQKRKYAKLKWIRCGKKGYGLEAVEEISEGRFLIEYVGEVLDMHTYEARQRQYAINGHRHFYFMTLNGSEVIDACAKGNLGRLINHSCDPNCRTEKWMVNGEVCVGLFALRDIKKGDELTFDYNYVRVFGAAAKKCVCGSNNCRGYIGGDPTNSEQAVQDDSDEEYIESVIFCEDKKINEGLNETMPDLPKTGEQAMMKVESVNKHSMKKSRTAAAKRVAGPLPTEKIDSFNSADSDVSVDGEILEFKETIGKDVAAKADLGRKVSIEQTEIKAKSQDDDKPICSSPQPFDSLPSLSEGVFSQHESCAHEHEFTTTTCKESLAAFASKRGLEHASVGPKEEPERYKVPVKTKLPSVPIKRRGKMNTRIDKGIPEVHSLNSAVDKSRSMVEFSLSGHFEAVEHKLNELLDHEGGISKRKDASRGYLKLLFLTAASENSGDGEAIQSNRNLSMILDALVKTKSRTVLVDITNKNGLQMLHNIMKRYRKEFIKTPILRKLLKVLEYLAMRNILTLEHITGGPPCPGVESFKDSILTLTEHADKQVHQIARSFRDRWIPKHLRRKCSIGRDEGRIQRVIQGSALRSSFFSNDRGGKHSGNELQPVAAFGTAGTSGTVGFSSLGRNCATDGTRIRKRKSRWDCPAEDYPNSRTRVSLSGEENMNNISDIPPGFSSCQGPILVSAAPLDASSNQEREAANDIIPPGFSSLCNLPMIHAGSIPTAAMDKEMHMKDCSDSRTENNLADDEKVNTEEDMPPGFSSPCKASAVPCSPSLASIGHQEREVNYQQHRTSNNFTCEEPGKSYDRSALGFCSTAHMIPAGARVTDTSHLQRDLNMQQHPNRGGSINLLSTDDDAPPGFSSLCNGLTPVSGASPTTSNHQEKVIHMELNPCNSVCGDSQLKFNPRIPLSYGVPYSAIQLFGVKSSDDWIKAPGVPFHPLHSSCSSGDQDTENLEQCRRALTYPNGDNSSGVDPPKKYACIENPRQDIHHGYSNNLGRRFFRQQKGNQPKLPPWVRMRNGWSNPAARNGFSGGLANGVNEYTNSYS